MIYDFDEADSELTLLPMASRRALDASALKLSLAAYQTLSLADRRRLVQLGAAAEVDVAAVRALAARATPPALAEATTCEPDDLPPALAKALAPPRELDAAGWRDFTPLERYVLDKLHRRGRLTRLQIAFDEIQRRRQR